MVQEQAVSTVRMEIDALRVVNFALQQNGVALIQRLSIINDTAQPLQDLTLSITCEPEMCMPFSAHYDYIEANSTYDAGKIKLTLNGGMLAGMTEKTAGHLNVTLSLGDSVLVSQVQEITVLAYDEWHGYGIYPEMLCAFITPNHPQVGQITARAAQLLDKWTGDPSLDAYQTQDPNRVLSQAGAIYAALQEQNIVYAVPPASFEAAGQRVRLCDAVLQQKMGTCLDLSLLYAGCLEAIGLKPLLIIQPGHIFTGLWLEELSFPESVQDDATLVTKRLTHGINQIAVVECTAFAAGKKMSFDSAQQAVEQHLWEDKGVECIIDVSRARLCGVSPMPQRVLTEAGWTVERPEVSEKQLTDAPQVISEAVITEEVSDHQPVTKMMQWERKLLDLGLRNNLINLRLHRSVVPILTSSVDELENTLSDGKDFTIMAKPQNYQTAEPLQFEAIHDLQGHEELIQSEFKNKRLRSALTDAQLTKTLKQLYRSSKTSLEENGANTLYLALGLLRWYETNRSTKARYAPVILLPVEIVRKSAAQGYVLRLRDDDPQMNITILEKLKQDFRISVPGLDPLPMDEHGIDVRKVFTILRKAVMQQARWDVLESAYLGIFSFSQFVMWNDMRNRSDDLARNKIVRSLIDGKLAWEAEDMQVGETVPEDGVFLPLSADASQLFAIEKASEGVSFVLHGPPGTGKSQTITTLIANALAQGKTVLFVAEKMAALEVVQKRLTKIGLSPFCLELHSNKSKKRDVLEQLRMATEVTKNTTAEEYAARAEQLAGLRQELNEYASALHKATVCGKTLYELVSTCEYYADAPDIAPFTPAQLKKITPEILQAQDILAERLTAAAKAVGHPHGHPLDSVCCTEYSQHIRQVLPDMLETYEASIVRLREALDAFAAAAQLTVDPSMEGVTQLAQTADELLLWMNYPRSWAQAEAPQGMLSDIARMAQHYHNAAGLKTKLSATWKPEFLTQDAAALAQQWDSAAAKWFLARMMGQNGLIRRLNALAKTPVDKDSLRDHIADLIAYQQECANADQLYQKYSANLGALYVGEETDWQKVSNAAKNAQLSCGKLDPELRSRCAGDKSLAQPVRTACDAWDQFCAARDALYQLLSVSADPEAEDYLADQQKLTEAIYSNSGSMKEWIAWNAIAEEASNLGLGNLADAYRSGMEHDQVIPAYRKAIHQALAMQAIDADKALSGFSGAVFNEKIRQFKRLDEQVALLTQQEIFCRLAARIPNFAKEAAHSSELGILQRAIRSGGRGVSIRKLFEQLPNLLPRLCPCMLMSPISAAQYLDPKREGFHLVVFDEASQLPTCKAVGALARGENAVIVGDPKQMPPTTFFTSNTVDEDNLDTEDLESILDDCLALNIPQTHLLWHYRSRHESLIAFSNAQFYENKLYTFPSVNDRESKVRLVPVEGIFERGKQRQNRAEAEAIVAELKRRCHDETLSKQSVGVVTFNINQQNLIDDLLSEACREDAALDTWAYQSAEPVFIKNLENVQGDERDVILFSIGYGPDEDGKVYMNFGPLNRDGGWRRLNVAITRSRQEMIVFSTLQPEHIDLSRSSAEGVAALKGFLEYAQRQKLPQNQHTVKKQTLDADGIAASICEFLQENGYQTQRNVGHSAYRIDIGVVDPQNPEQYCLGILLDGNSYGDAKTTRDREIAQIGVLNGLGWRITRVWTMDWWDNSQQELNRLLNLLNQEAPEETPAEEEPLPPAPQPSLAAAVPTPAPTEQKPVYKATALKNTVVAAEDFLMLRHRAGIKKKVEAVIAQEAPISKALLTRRVVQSYGIGRAGSRIQGYMDKIYDSMGLLTTTMDDQIFYWAPEQDPAAYDIYRVAENEDDRRDAKDLPVQEAVNAVYQALADQLSLNNEDLIRESAKLMGYSRLGSAVSAAFTAAITYAQAQGKITASPNGNWILV